jgi:hypothetical protein
MRSSRNKNADIAEKTSQRKNKRRITHRFELRA